MISKLLARARIKIWVQVLVLNLHKVIWKVISVCLMISVVCGFYKSELGNHKNFSKNIFLTSFCQFLLSIGQYLCEENGKSYSLSRKHYKWYYARHHLRYCGSWNRGRHSCDINMGKNTLRKYSLYKCYTEEDNML